MESLEGTHQIAAEYCEVSEVLLRIHSEVSRRSMENFEASVEYGWICGRLILGEPR